MLDVTALVQQMRDTLSEIHDTITSLDTKGHDEKLDALESQRDEVFRQLQSAFEKESAELSQRRQAERDEIAEKRRKEDEEIAARRRREDEDKATRDHDQDAEREQKLEGEKEGVEQETDEKMDRIEEEAKRMLDEGHNKLKDLEDRRREINRMIDEQMKAPLPPPPARRARRGTRASQGGVSGQTESSRPQESGATLEAQSQDQTREVEASTSRSIEPEESREQGLSQAEPKSNEPPQESSSPEQASAEEKSPPQDQPQGQVAESVAEHESPSDKPSSQEDPGQVQEQETASESHAMSGDNREIPEAMVENHDPVPGQATGEDQDSSNRAAEQAAPPSVKSERPEEATTDTAQGDVGDSDQKDLAQDESATETSDSKPRELDSVDAQEHSQSGNGDASIATPSHTQDQALGVESEGTVSSSDNAGQSTDLPAANNHQEALAAREDPGSPDQLTASEHKTTDDPAREEEPDHSRSQPTTDGPTTSDSPSEHGAPKGSDNDDLFHGVAKGGAAEEYVKMAEAESGQESQPGGKTSSVPEQNSLSGSGQSREQQDEDPSRGIEEPETAQLGSSTTDRESPEHTSHAQADEPLSTSGEADSVEDKGRSPVESEGGSGQLQSRDIGSLDHGRSHDEPTVNPDQQLPSSSGQPELGQSQDLGSSLTGDSKHEELSSSSQDSPDVDSSKGERLQEPGLVDHSQNETASTEPGFQSRNLDLAQNPESGDNTVSKHGASGSEKDAADGRPAEDQQELHGNEQRNLSLEHEHGQQEQPGHDAVTGVESESAGQQGPSSSDPSAPATSSHDSQLEKDLGNNQDTGSISGHEEAVESHDAPQTSVEESVSGDTETPRQSSHVTSNIVEPSKTDALHHESAGEQEPGDKRSDSGYETGMASSRNLEDSTTTLHEDQHEHQHVQEAEQSLASAPSESEQEKPRQPRPEQILEGSGKGASPPRLGGEHQGSDDHPVEETFDLSGSEPIPGTMTHGKDETEGQAKELAGGDVSSQDVSHQRPDDDLAVGAPADENQRGEAVDETHEKQDVRGPLPHESSQEADHDHTQPDSQSVAHDADNTIPADSRNQVAEAQLQQGDSQSVAEPLGQGPSDEMESSSKLPTEVGPQDQASMSNDGQAEQSHPEDDVKNTTSRDTDEPQPNTTDGPNEDADEGLFAVPPTPRHEVDHDKPSQLQSDGDSKPSSRASSRNGSTGADTLSPKAAEGLQGSYREESDRELPQEASATKEDVHNEVSHSPDGAQQPRPDVFETSDSPEEKTAGSRVDSEESSNRGTPDRGQPEESSVTGNESLPHETSAGDDHEQKGQKHSANSPSSPAEQSIADERQLDKPLQPGTFSVEQHTGDAPSKPEVKEEHSEETQAGSDNLSRGTSLEHDSEPYGLTKEHGLSQEGSSSSHTGGQTLESAGNVNQQEGPQEDFSPREMSTQPKSERSERDSGESGNRSLGESGQVQHGEISEPRPLEERPSQSVSPEDKEISSGQDSNRQIADPPQIGQGETQHPESGPGSDGEQLEQGHADTDRIAHQPPPDHSNQHFGAQRVNYDGEGYGVTPSSEYSNDTLADSAPRETKETHPADDSIDTRQPEPHTYDMDSGSETFETPLESADFRRSHQDGRSVTPGHFSQALEHLPGESAHTVQGTDDLFDDTDDAEDQDDYGEAVVYQHSNEAAESSPGEEKTVYSTRGDENNTALGGHRSSLSLGSVGHRSQGSISSMRDTTPVRPTFGSYIGGPSIVRADWAAEHEEELRPSSRNPTPQLGPSTTHDTPEISPFALRNTPVPSHGSDQRGLSSSMWNPERPQTPTSATSHSNNPFATPQRQAESDMDPSLFVPRDVTHGRQDSVPASLHSQTTLDSSWSSPVHSSLPVDRHEPVIRDSWPAPAPGYQQYLSSWGSRPRGDTTSTAPEYDPFRPDNGGAPGGHLAAKSSSSYNPFLQRGRAESSVSTAPSNPSVSNSPSRGSALFAKMRNIFENQSSNGASDAPASPGRTRPVSGVFHPAVSAPRKSQDSFTGPRDDERGGFLNEADHEIDERSAFLRSDGQPSGHMGYNDEH
ncbi:hypothetical protein INS49_005249 [Diaporthe citri]|uniref:uncharacterized protein n=1 Tax=Diaporthe citri TaxID=83186 RepID=UPI001C7E9B3C|nr:uncharacterized protein INS49_005249 [Diaporthe citri]KAG6353770.1 hypothetical protein INS49_005249 [Diaporthe citri]